VAKEGLTATIDHPIMDSSSLYEA